MTLKRFLLFISSIAGCVVIAKIVTACADGPSTYYEPSFFLNTINTQPAFVPFYYAPELNYYDEGWDFDEFKIDTKVPDQNITMWRLYTGKEVARADIDSFVYRYAGKDATTLYRHIKKKEPLLVPDEVQNNEFTKWLVARKDAEASQYLAFAKRCEKHATPLDGNWNELTNKWEVPARDSFTMQNLVKEGIQYYETAKNSEIRLRYAYQVMRMSFYCGSYTQTADLFNTLVTERSNNVLYCRCLALKAGALYKQGKKAEAAYLYSIVFDKNDDNKKGVYTSFRWSVNGKIEPVLALCKNDHEKAVLYIMQGLYAYEGSDRTVSTVLQKAYSLDPAIRGLDIVMTRFINKLEGERIADMATVSDKRDAQLNELNTFAQKVARDGKNGDAGYWYLASSYIYLMNGDLAGCRKFMDIAAKEKLSPAEEGVRGILNALYIIRRDGKITKQTEADLLTVMKDVEARSNEDKRYVNVFSDILIRVLKQVYLKQGDMEKALYCYSKANADHAPQSAEYVEDYTDDPGAMLEGMTAEQLHGVQAFYAKKNKTPFEAWLTANSRYTLAALYELEGTHYIRMYQFEKAVEVLKKVPDELLKKWELPDVMVSHVLDNQVINRSDKIVSYNKRTFAERMVDLQQRLKKKPGDGRVAYQYANGLYSMSYYGKAHHAYDYYRSCVDENAYYDHFNRSKLKDYEQEHYMVRLPEKYYEQAFENSDDREAKARCLFMAAKCWQKNCPYAGEKEYFYPNAGIYYQNTFRNPYFLKLKKDFSDTKFYASASGTCSYFRDYAWAGAK